MQYACNVVCLVQLACMLSVVERYVQVSIYYTYVCIYYTICCTFQVFKYKKISRANKCVLITFQTTVTKKKDPGESVQTQYQKFFKHHILKVERRIL